MCDQSVSLAQGGHYFMPFPNFSSRSCWRDSDRWHSLADNKNEAKIPAAIRHMGLYGEIIQI